MIYITGHTGALGTAVGELVHDFVGISRSTGVDLSMPNVALDLLKRFPEPSLIFHLAAETNMSSYNIREDASLKETETIMKNVLAMAAVSCAKIVYMSTNDIFDGMEGMYDESSVPSPRNNYARCKLLAESMLSEDDVIVRGTFMTLKKSGLTSWYTFAIESLLNGEAVYAYTDQVHSPVSVHGMAKALVNLGSSRGVWNVGCKGRYSRYDTILEMASQIGAPESLVVPMNSPQAYDLSLSCLKYASLFGNLSLREEISTMIDAYEGEVDG